MTKFKPIKTMMVELKAAGLEVKETSLDKGMALQVFDPEEDWDLVITQLGRKIKLAGSLLSDIGADYPAIGLSVVGGRVSAIKAQIAQAIKTQVKFRKFVALVKECKEAGLKVEVKRKDLCLEMRVYENAKSLFVVRAYFEHPDLLILGGEMVDATGVIPMPTEEITELKEQIAFAFSWNAANA